MRRQERFYNFTNPFDILTEEIIFAILDNLNDDPFAKRSFSLVCKSFYFIECHHRRGLKPLRSDLLSRLFHRYPSISHLDLSLCPLFEDNLLCSLSLAWKSSLRSINLSRSRSFTSIGLSSLATNCLNLVEIDLSNSADLNDSTAKAVAEAQNLERLSLASCKSITDIGICCIAVGCRKLKSVCLRWCLRVSDLGVELIAMKCKEIRSLDLSYLSITEKCLTPVLQLPHLEDLILEGCLGIDDDGLATLKNSSKSIKTIELTKCENVSHVGLAALTNGAESLEQLVLSYGPAIKADLTKCLQPLSKLQSVKLDGCLVTCYGMKFIGNWDASLRELGLSKCLGVTDECISFLAQKQKELRKLDITCCRKITYVSIDSITNYCTSLTSLRMESCSLVKKDSFALIGQRCQLLEELDVTDNEIDNEGLKAISSCSKLRILKLGICLNITDDGLAHIGDCCTKLREVDLYRSPGITDTGITAIAQGCPALEMINFAYNSKITDLSLIALSKCLNLRVLEIRACPLVSSHGLFAIAKGCRQLAVLDIKKCFNIDNNAMIPLAKFSQNLKQINLSYCSVTDVGLLSLACINQLQSMTILHLAGLTPNGLAAALLACRGLRKVKLHTSFKPLLPQYIFKYMESRGCVFQWRNKAYQTELDPKGWQLHHERCTEAT